MKLYRTFVFVTLTSSDYRRTMRPKRILLLCAIFCIVSTKTSCNAQDYYCETIIFQPVVLCYHSAVLVPPSYSCWISFTYFIILLNTNFLLNIWHCRIKTEMNDSCITFEHNHMVNVDTVNNFFFKSFKS